MSLATLLIVAACTRSSNPAMERLWVNSAEWPERPTDPNEPWTTPGIVVAFCPGGDFRMASGTFYGRESGSVALGASDGIAIFRGHWSGSLDHLSITYWVQSAEIVPRDRNIIGKKTTTLARQVPGSNALVFSYFRWFVEPPLIDIEIKPASSAAFGVSDRFVECSGGEM